MNTTTMRLVCDQRSTTLSAPSKSTQFMNDAFEAVMAAVFDEQCSQMTMMSNGMWMLTTAGTEVALPSNKMTVSLLDAITRYSSAELEMATVLITSDTLSGPGLLKELKQMIAAHMMCNRSADDPKFIFDTRSASIGRESINRVNQYVNQTSDHVARMQRIVSAPKTLSFSKHLFQSTKTFANLCGHDIRELRRRVDFFLNNREWYAAKGIPYQLGIMLSGPCGTGKNSAIRAIANATNRHIVNVNLASIATSNQLKRLFLNDTLHVFETDDQAESTPMHLPVAERIYVLDEVDALGAAVLDRGSTDVKSAQIMPDEVSLGEILNIFDGGVEVPGRIIVMLSNYWERLDPALIRPGRIDIHMKLGLCTREDLAELFCIYYDAELPSEDFEGLPHLVISPAEASDVFISNRSRPVLDIPSIVSDLNEIASKKCA